MKLSSAFKDKKLKWAIISISPDLPQPIGVLPVLAMDERGLCSPWRIPWAPGISPPPVCTPTFSVSVPETGMLHLPTSLPGEHFKSSRRNSMFYQDLGLKPLFYSGNKLKMSSSSLENINSDYYTLLWEGKGKQTATLTWKAWWSQAPGNPWRRSLESLLLPSSETSQRM